MKGSKLLRAATATVAGALCLAAAGPAHAGTIMFGDADLSNTGSYSGSDPTAGAATEGLAAEVVNYGTNSFRHNFPFSPSPTDFAGTDQIYLGSLQTTTRYDGYALFGSWVRGPQTFSLGYSSLVPAGQAIDTFTLGIMADDFQQPAWHQPFTAKINGVVNAALTAALNSLNQTGPYAQFVSVGLNPSLLAAGHTLTLSIDEGGDGGDGWAVDFLTVGVTSSPVAAAPLPAAACGGLALMGGLGLTRGRRRAGRPD